MLARCVQTQCFPAASSVNKLSQLSSMGSVLCGLITHSLTHSTAICSRISWTTYGYLATTASTIGGICFVKWSNTYTCTHSSCRGWGFWCTVTWIWKEGERVDHSHSYQALSGHQRETESVREGGRERERERERETINRKHGQTNADKRMCRRDGRGIDICNWRQAHKKTWLCCELVLSCTFQHSNE